MNNTGKSMLDVAVEIFTASSSPVPFGDLWAKICETLELTEEESREKLPLFYTTLSLDGRFVVLSEDLWDLKAKHAYDEVHRDINDIYSNDEEDHDPEDNDDDDETDKPNKKDNKDRDAEDSDDEENDESDDEEKGNREENY